MSTARIRLVFAAIFLTTLALVCTPPRADAQGTARPRIFILMVWDGMRPDFVTQRDTPNLYALEHNGVRFDRHHAQFPTLTMVNAAALATGATPGTAGIFGDTMYMWPLLKARGVEIGAEGIAPFVPGAVMLESSKRLADLNAADALKGGLLGVDSVAQEVARAGGYIAVAGKQGPTFLFDDRVLTVTGGKDSLGEAHANYLFASDDMAAPPADAPSLLAHLPAATRNGVADADRDRYFAHVVADRAIPAAKKATDAGHPALIVFWQHNPDLTQHLSGLGTLPAIEALGMADENLATVRASIAANGVGDRTDLMVVSDHGFATIRLRISLAAMLVSAGLKKSATSTDVVVAPNGGADLVYLSRDEFKTIDQIRDRLQKIVNFAEAQEWVGSIFSRDSASASVTGTARRGGAARLLPAGALFRGWIDGTFAQSAIGLRSDERSPDLIISFAEIPDIDNRGFTGPKAPAFAIGVDGQQAVPNHSQPLVRPVKGLLYADSGAGNGWTTGMGMHGAAGMREIHNVCAAVGPDFKRGFADENPSGNVDIAPTIADVLGVAQRGYVDGRVLSEAIVGGRPWAGLAHQITATTELELQGVEAIARLRMTKLGTRIYLDDSSVERRPLGSSP